MVIFSYLNLMIYNKVLSGSFNVNFFNNPSKVGPIKKKAEECSQFDM